MAWAEIVQTLKGPLGAAAGGALSGFATGFLTAWYGPKRQHYFWGRQQYVSLCLDAYKRFVDVADEYAATVYQKSQTPYGAFTMKLLSITGDLKVLFGISEAWQAFLAFDNLLSQGSTPRPTQFMEARDKARI